jgi:zinc transporter ZupT
MEGIRCPISNADPTTLCYNKFVLLFAGIIALLVGPLAYLLLRERVGLGRVLDTGATLVITALAALILWDTALEGGWPVAVFALAGLGGPLLAEALLHHKERGVHVATLALGVAGLLLHSAADGAALLSGHMGVHEELSWAVILHNVPAGLAIWWLVQANFGVRAAGAVLALLALATLGGYVAAAQIAGMAGQTEFAWLQAFVAGSLLHLTYHRLRGGRHAHRHGHPHAH